MIKKYNVTYGYVIQIKIDIHTKFKSDDFKFSKKQTKFQASISLSKLVVIFTNNENKFLHNF